MPARPILRALGDRMGILPEYTDQAGKRRVTSDGTRARLLGAMGVDASSEATAAAALDGLSDLREGKHSAACIVSQKESALLSVPVPRALSSRLAEWEIEIEREDGGRERMGARRDGRSRRPIMVRGRGARRLPLGYHRLRFDLRTHDGESHAGDRALVVTPESCLRWDEKLNRRGVYGLLAQLYTLRSEANWGIGDLGDLGRLIDWSARVGAAFVGLNPLHALANAGGDISPYSPLTRLFRNPIYLDLDQIPELGPEIRKRRRARRVSEALARVRAAEHVDYEAVMKLKGPLLERAYAAFRGRCVGRSPSRRREFGRFVEREGEALARFATFLVLRERLSPRYGSDWRRWPASYRSPDTAAVRDFARRHRARIDFHRFLQFEVERQLHTLAKRARSRGLAVGLYEDLAIGSSSAGSDAWAFSDLFADGASMGAPPDAWYACGQDWGFRPVDPRRLTATGYDYWIRLLRSAMRFAGALRIDHVMGLFRQFWIPEGRPPSEGAYVRFPCEDLLGILALESRRAGALVIGEDLGTVPRGLPALLSRWGILSTCVLPFQRSASGAFSPAKAYPADALVSANTHDMVPFAGYWAGRDIEIRQQTGQFRSRRAVARERQGRARERQALLRRLRREGLLNGAGEVLDGAKLRGAVHGFLCKTPAAMVGIALDDLTGETEPVNVPGVGPDQFRVWSRKLRLPVDAFDDDAGVRAALALTTPRARARRPSVTASRRGARGGVGRRRRQAERAK